MKTWVLLLGCLLALTSHAQTRREVYQWTDADGVTHFSDFPQPGARRIILNGAPAATPPSQPTAAPRRAPPAAPAEVQYDRLEILSPTNDEAFFQPDVEIVVRVRSEPELDAADRLVTYLDGQPLGELNAVEHRLTDIPRGAHSLTSVIFGRDGREKIRSAPVVFHMKLPSVTNPRNLGPSIRPPQAVPLPRPRPTGG
jgi:hypothetical protein